MKPEAHVVPEARFIGEQKGPFESLLTSKLSHEFASGGLVSRAYLVNAMYGHEPSARHVVLAVRTLTGCDEPAVLSAINSAFAYIFKRDEHLDIMFVGEATERAIRQVCQPFYASTEGKPLNR